MLHLVFLVDLIFVFHCLFFRLSTCVGAYEMRIYLFRKQVFRIECLKRQCASFDMLPSKYARRFVKLLYYFNIVCEEWIDGWIVRQIDEKKKDEHQRMSRPCQIVVRAIYPSKQRFYKPTYMYVCVSRTRGKRERETREDRHVYTSIQMICRCSDA